MHVFLLLRNPVHIPFVRGHPPIRTMDRIPRPKAASVSLIYTLTYPRSSFKVNIRKYSGGQKFKMTVRSVDNFTILLCTK